MYDFGLQKWNVSQNFYKSHDRLTENGPFRNHKSKYFIVQMVAYTMVHVSSEQGKSVIWKHIIDLPLKIYINFKIEV